MPLVRPVFFILLCASAGLAWHDWRLLSRAPSTPPVEIGAAATDIATPEVSLDTLPTLPLFGASTQASPAEPARITKDALPEAAVSYRLFGIIAATTTQPSLAILGTGDADQAPYREGDASPDGATIAAIEPTSIVLERNGKRERLPLADALGTGGGGGELLPAAQPTAEVDPIVDADGEPIVPPPPPPAAAASLKAKIEARRAAARQPQAP